MLERDVYSVWDSASAASYNSEHSDLEGVWLIGHLMPHKGIGTKAETCFISTLNEGNGYVTAIYGIFIHFTL